MSKNLQELKDTQEAKDVVCALIAAAGGTLRGKVRLYKGFYHAHLIHWQQNPGLLTQHPIVHMPKGPGIDGANALLDELVSEGRIAVRTEAGEEVFTLIGSNPLPQGDLRYLAIQQAYTKVKDKTGNQLSHDTHESSRSWNNTISGEEMNIYSDTVEEDEHKRIHSLTPQVEELVYSAFGRVF